MFFACGQKGYVITGTIEGDGHPVKDGTAVLFIPVGLEVVDTAKITDGKFEFRSTEVNPGNYAIGVRDVQGSIPIFIEEGRFTVKADIEKLSAGRAEGGETQNLNNIVKDKREEILPRNEYNALNQELMSDIPQERRDEINAIIEKGAKEFDDFKLELAKKHPDSYYAANYLIYNYSNLPFEEVKPLADKILSNKKFENYAKVPVVRRFMEIMEKENQGK